MARRREGVQLGADRATEGSIQGGFSVTGSNSQQVAGDNGKGKIRTQIFSIHPSGKAEGWD